MAMQLHFYQGTVSEGVFTAHAVFDASISIRENPVDDDILQLNENFIFNYYGNDYQATYGGAVPGGVYFTYYGSPMAALTAPISLPTPLAISNINFDLENLAPVPCFLAGTRIETSRGVVAVEDLVEGDLLRTLSGEMKPLRWIGHRVVSPRLAAAQPQKSLPIRLAASALAEGLPSRDLWVSPDHCLYHEGVLIEAKRLVNGTTVTQAQPSGAIIYYHLLLDHHDVVFAEGVTAETYRPTGNSFGFQNAESFPGDIAAHQTEEFSCFPVKYSGAKVEALRAVLAMQAEILNCTAQQAAA